MYNLFQAECYKLWRNRIFWAIHITIFILFFFLMSMVYLDDKGYFKSDNVSIEVQDVVTTEALSGSKFLIERIYGPDAFITVFFVTFLGAFFLTRDHDVGTMKNIVSLGYSRWKIYLIKNLVLAIGTLLITVSLILAPVLISSLFYGFGDLINQEILINLIKALAISSLYFIAIATVLTLLSLLSRNPAITVGLGLGIYIVLDAGLHYLSGRYMVFEKIQKFSIFHQLPKIGKRVFDGESLLFSLVLPLLTIGISLFIGMFLFQRKEIK